MTTQTIVHTQYDSFDVPGLEPSPFILQAERFLKGNANPISYYAVILKNLTTIKGFENKDAMAILEVAEMRITQLVARMMKVSGMARKLHKNTRAVKMADLYRRYEPTLHIIMERGGEYSFDARDLVTSMYLEQTLPDGELMSPDYKDSYTGELLDSEDIDIQVPELSPMSIENQMVAADLGWDEKTFNQFLKAQSGGYTEFEMDEETAEEDRGYVPPTLTKDFVINPQLQAESWKYIKAFNEMRSNFFEEQERQAQITKKILAAIRVELHLPATEENKKVVMSAYRDLEVFLARQKEQKNDWAVKFQKYMLKSLAYADMVNCIERIAGEDTVTGAAVYLKVQGEFGLNEQDIEGMKVYEDAYSTLGAFLEMNEEDILELMNDNASSPMSESDVLPWIVGLEELNKIELERVMPKNDVNPLNTASWNIAYANAMASGATMDQAEGAGFSAWRTTMSPDGANAYNLVLAETSNRKSAMSAFWKHCGSTVPRPRQKIESIQGNLQGLILAGGRPISWAIACLKVRGNELDLSGDIKERLIAKLTELKVGAQFVALL